MSSLCAREIKLNLGAPVNKRRKQRTANLLSGGWEISSGVARLRDQPGVVSGPVRHGVAHQP